jgi:rhodanese-related sulfurtransferase
MTDDRALKDALYGQLAEVAKAIANPHRLELLDLLAQAPRTVEVLANMTGLSIANASQHLRTMRAAGLVDTSKSGSFVTYRVAHRDVASLLVKLRSLEDARRDAMASALRAIEEKAGDVEALNQRDLVKRVERGEVILLDVRPSEEFAAAHVRGAKSIALNDLKARLRELPKKKKIVAYCRGPYCMFASEAVRVLRAAGYDATVMREGVTELRAMGLPIEEGATA